MTIGIKARAAAYLEAAHDIRAIDARPVPEAERLEAVAERLKTLADQTELFPLHSYPRAEGTPGGLYRLAGFPDRRGAIYVSLGFVGRRQAPHNHVSWAAVAGVIGGRETNVVYERVDDPESGGARLVHKETVAVGPGDVVHLPSGHYHTIDVESGPSLHLHAYSWAVDAPGFETYGFDSPEATTWQTRTTGGFKPPLSAVEDGDITEDVARGDAAVAVLGGDIRSLQGPLVLYTGVDTILDDLKAAGVGAETPVILAGAGATGVAIAERLYAAGWPLVFEHRTADLAQAAA